MAGRILDKAITRNKFRGAFTGGLIGDCLASPFQQDDFVAKVILQKYFDKMEDPSFKSPAKSYSGDTAMMKVLTGSIIQNGSLNEIDIAKRLVANYFSNKEPDRNYSKVKDTIFRKLKNSKFTDVWLPAKEQFNGEGTFGNGGAARVTPIALFCYSNYDLMLENVEKCTKLTHVHKLGINGALLQAIAINQSFCQIPSDTLNINEYLTELINKINKLEKSETDNSYVNEEEHAPYQNRLKEIQGLLKIGEVDDEEVIVKLGNGPDALNSVPTAIYCFLRSQKQIKSIETENKFRRAVQYSISLGGDTETIASMTGAISGAYHGYEYINSIIQSHCEKHSEILSLADQLHDAAV